MAKKSMIAKAARTPKFAVRAFSDSLRREMLAFNVKVILIEPGPIKTEIWSKSISESELLEAKFSSEIKQVYSQALKQLKFEVKKTAEEAIAVKGVTQLIITAIDNAKPKPYYLIGKNIFVVNFLTKILPVRLLDRLLAKGFRFSKLP